MNTEDKAAFSKILRFTYELYDANVPSAAIMSMWWETLERFDFKEVSAAFNRHIQNIDNGTFKPKPADIIRQLEGKPPTADEVIALARLANTPIGCIARIQIGTWDLNNQDGFYLRQRAAEVLAMWESIIAQCRTGSYSSHQISVMKKYNVSPLDPLAPGLPEPLPEYREKLSWRTENIPALEKLYSPPQGGEASKAGVAKVGKLLKGTGALLTGTSEKADK